jgi:hypothetical protein
MCSRDDWLTQAGPGFMSAAAGRNGVWIFAAAGPGDRNKRPAVP